MKVNRKKAFLWGVIILVFGSIFVEQQFIINRLNKQYKVYQEQLKNLKSKNDNLKEELKQIQRKDYIERVAREKLGLIKPDEVLIKDRNKKK
ncbi:FtsB family cell division protein [Fonticella tunisiensis]|uniref:Septum formation initiator n=1 Tax=Fonticella tunisiensis TaxID=1096341 RepID=A0A4R7KVD7_9CLOT|nr:septum formation initiator family protein [Fonticella tunisiensis]TDT63471.1 septum formation initiator [Fonticella tunisiensis]